MKIKKLKKLASAYDLTVQLLEDNDFYIIIDPDATDLKFGALEGDLYLFNENDDAEELARINKHFACYNKDNGSDLSIDLYYFHPIPKNKVDKMIERIKKITKQMDNIKLSEISSEQYDELSATVSEMYDAAENICWHKD